MKYKISLGGAKRFVREKTLRPVTYESAAKALDHLDMLV